MPNQFTQGRALVIGVANYPSVPRLPETVLNDARDVAALLRSPDHCGYPAAQVEVLLDGQATASGIRDALRRLAQATAEERDTVLLYFSGHGGRIETGSDAGEYLIPFDCDPNNLVGTAISGSEIPDLLKTIKAQRLVLFLDACHSSGAADVKSLEPAPGIKAGLAEKTYTALAQRVGRVVMASSRPNEASVVLPGMRNGLFTHHLLDALQGAAPTHGDGLVRVFDVVQYVLDKVSAQTADQHPIFMAHVADNNFPLALYLGGKQATSPADRPDPTKRATTLSRKAKRTLSKKLGTRKVGGLSRDAGTALLRSLGVPRIRITLLGSLALEAGRLRSLSARMPVEWLASTAEGFLNADLLVHRADEPAGEIPAPARKLITSWAQTPATGAALDAAVQASLAEVYGFVVGYASQLWTACRWVRSLAHPASAALGLSTLVVGESGTGKELVARAIHRLGVRAGSPFLTINCAGLPRELAASILFGHAKGAFTGADAPHRGYFEAVGDGVLFLDEVGDLPLDLQPLLLRALEQREFTRVGETVPRFFQGQLVSATNRRLDQDVSRGVFRADLYFRIAQVSIPLPALRDRPLEDFPLLVRALLADLGGGDELPPGELLGDLRAYPWPGNIRELRIVLQRWLLLRRTGQSPALADLLLPLPGPPADVPARGTLAELREDLDRRVLQSVLARCGGDTKKAAHELGITRRSVYNLAKRYQIPVSLHRGE